MNCPECQTQNGDNAQFCKNCGIHLHMRSESKNDNNLSDTLLFIFILVGFVAVIVGFAIQKFVPNWYESPVKYVQGAIWILNNLSFILIPIAIRNRTLKVIGLIVGILLVIYWLYSNIEFLIR
jgi:hypothetical protein